jgi:TetR/AcrR family transcriptional regulator
MSITVSRREREKKERRSAIIDAAERVFFRKGFEAATMDEVAAEAELSKGTLYLYFKSKDELFIALSGRIIGQLVERFEAIAGSPGNGLEHIERLMFEYTSFALAHPKHFRTALTWMAAAQPVDTSTPAFVRHRQLIARVVACFVGAIQRGHADGSVRRDINPVETAAQLWGGLLGTILIRVNGDEMLRRFPHPVDLDQFTTGYVRLITSGLRPADDQCKETES